MNIFFHFSKPVVKFESQSILTEAIFLNFSTNARFFMVRICKTIIRSVQTHGTTSENIIRFLMSNFLVIFSPNRKYFIHFVSKTIESQFYSRQYFVVRDKLEMTVDWEIVYQKGYRRLLAQNVDGQLAIHSSQFERHLLPRIVSPFKGPLFHSQREFSPSSHTFIYIFYSILNKGKSVFFPPKICYSQFFSSFLRQLQTV